MNHTFSWNTKKYAGRLLCAASLALLSICALPDPRKLVQQRGVTLSSFNSATAIPSKLPSLEERLGDRAVKISLSFRAGPGNSEGNLFQTSGGNAGIRAELSGGTTLSVLTASGAGAQELDLPDSIVPGAWHRLEIRTDVRNRTCIYLDGRERREMSVSESAPKLDSIIVGAAFDGRRIFRGEIKDFSIRLDSYKRVDLNKWRLLLSLFFLGAALNYFRFVFAERRFVTLSLGRYFASSVMAIRFPALKALALLALSVSGVTVVQRFGPALPWPPAYWLCWGMAALFLVVLLVYACDFLSRSASVMMESGLLPKVNLSSDRKIKFLSLFVLSGFVLAVAYHFVLGAYGNAQYPYNTFLFHPEDAFNDIRNPFGMVYGFRPYMPKEFMETATYFPFAYLPIYAFSILGNSLRLPLYMGIFIILFVWLGNRHMRYETRGLWQWVEYVRDFCVISFLSYPFLFTLDRANFEMYVFLLIAFFLYFFRRRNDTVAALCLSAAIACKGYPAIFLVLFLRDRKYRAVIHTCIYSALMILVPLFLYGGGFMENLRGFLLGLSDFKHYYVLGMRGYVHNSCIYNVIRVIYVGVFHNSDLASLARIYSVLGAILGLEAAIYVWLGEKTFWKQVMILSAAAILVTPVSGNYKLLMLFMPLWLFIEDKEQTRFTPFYCLLFALLLIPKEYPFGFSIPGFEHFRLSGFLNPLLLAVFCGLLGLERAETDSAR